MHRKKDSKYDIFISYRRDGGYETAKHLYDLLKHDGYSVSFDIDTLGNGTFDTELLKRIDECSDFIIVLTEGALNRCVDSSFPMENDWLRNELSYAIKHNKNIIPLLGSDFNFPDNLPEDIRKIQFYNGIVYNRAYFDAMYSKLKSFLKAKPERGGNAKFGILFAVLLLALAVFGYFFTRENNTSVSGPELVIEPADEIRGGVIIKASLLDSTFVGSDSVVSKAVSRNDYFGLDVESDLKFYEEFHYSESRLSDTCIISPWGRYVGDYYSMNHIVIDNPTFTTGSEDVYTNTHYPLLDIKLVNNSGESVVIDNLEIAVEESKVDSRPFVVVTESAGNLYFKDRGWVKWNNCEFRFSLTPTKPKTAPRTFDFKFNVTSADLKKSENPYRINMYDYLVAAGVDFEIIEKLSIIHGSAENKAIPYWTPHFRTDLQVKALDSLKQKICPIPIASRELEGEIQCSDPGMWLTGVMDFDNGKHIITVEGFVRILTCEGYGDSGLAVKRVFDVKFKDQGKNYTINYPVSRLLKDGEGDRIVLQLNADKTSRHRFKIKLNNINGRSYESNPVDLLIFKYNR